MKCKNQCIGSLFVLKVSSLVHYPHAGLEVYCCVLYCVLLDTLKSPQKQPLVMFLTLMSRWSTSSSMWGELHLQPVPSQPVLQTGPAWLGVLAVTWTGGIGGHSHWPVRSLTVRTTDCSSPLMRSYWQDRDPDTVWSRGEGPGAVRRPCSFGRKG